MLPGIAAVRRATALAEAVDGSPASRATLAGAVEYVWLASTHRFGWPADVRDAADAVIALACRSGAIGQAAERFSEDEAREAAVLIRRLADAAERRDASGADVRP